jgi:hypothetical protein
MLRYLIAWIPMLVLAIANGALREATYARWMPELRAHQLSTAIGAAIFGVYIELVIRAWPPVSTQQAPQVGLCWLVLMVLFEFFMGLALARRPLREVLRDYNVARGRVWVFLLLWITVAPVVFQALDAN